MRSGSKIIVGDATGIDRQVQDYLNKKLYKNVEVYSPGKESRYLANKKWTNHLIDDPDHEPMSPEWLAKKDIVMSKAADKGIAVILDQGSGATRNNIARLEKDGKKVSVYQLNRKPTKEENFDPFKAMNKIDKSLSKKEQNLLGVDNGYHSTDDIKFFFNKEKSAYLITADYHGKYKDEHPISGKIIGIAAMPKARGTGATDKLIQNAKNEFSNDRLVAEIDKGNIASKKLFKRNGFKKIKEDNGVEYYVYDQRRQK
jgi:ribosomal protein S18 acetylase RimI-like enzyme